MLILLSHAVTSPFRQCHHIQGQYDLEKMATLLPWTSLSMACLADMVAKRSGEANVVGSLDSEERLVIDTKMREVEGV